ncbi:MAG: hypothetical protein ACOYBJ_01625 [Patescibacteria group bacterium]
MLNTIPMSDRELQDVLDVIDIDVHRASSGQELEAAYAALVIPDRLGVRNHRRVLELAGAARLARLVLMGYERSDASQRFASNRALTQLVRLFDDLQVHEGVAVQFWIILAGQRAFLLDQVEHDLDAWLHATHSDLGSSSGMTNLLELHALLTDQADEAIAFSLGIGTVA